MNLDLYEIVKLLFKSKEKEVWLVTHKITKTFYVKKTIYNIQHLAIYEQLLTHPHPNMVKVYACEMKGKDLIIIEEFINGVTLEFESSKRDFKNDEIDHIMCELMNVTKHLHNLNPPIIHRDIKPENIFVVGNEIKLLDFEIARTYKEHQQKDTNLLGSVGYASPEHYGFKQSDARSDIYSLGVVLKSLLQKDIDEACVPSIYKNIIETCTQVDANNRFQNMEEMEDEFKLLTSNKNILQSIIAKLSRLPGFHERKTGKKIAIWIYYFFACIFSFSMNYVGGNVVISNIIIKIITLCSFFFALWIPLGKSRKYLPLLKSNLFIIRLFGAIILWFILLIAFFIITSPLLKLDSLL